MQFVLLGFGQRAGVRLYAFQSCIDRTRTDFSVAVDLALTQRYGIRIQELPLLCRELLERQVREGEGTRQLAFTEDEMHLYAANCATAREAAAHRRKRVRKPPTDSAASPWRGPRP